ncbi:MAG: hypothetical protein UHN02_07005 [Acutalibacteraceae bacterium]|nr:hypothetical protein [Acutalibacteraceae bacterium]
MTTPFGNMVFIAQVRYSLPSVPNFLPAIKIIFSHSGSIKFSSINTQGIEYKPVKVFLTGNTFTDDKQRVICGDGREAEVTELNN